MAPLSLPTIKAVNEVRITRFKEQIAQTLAAGGLDVFRSLVETVRLPDGHIGYLYGTDWFTMGMQLSAPMVVAGAVILVVAYRRPAAFGTKGT